MNICVTTTPDVSPVPSVPGDGKHIYRVIVEKVLVQSVLVGAASQDDAESKAYKLASTVPATSLLWREERTRLKDCTSVQQDDGSWKFCNAMGYCDAR